MDAKLASLTDVMHFFGFEKSADFTREWKQLSAEDQADLKRGIGDGSFNY